MPEILEERASLFTVESLPCLASNIVERVVFVGTIMPAGNWYSAPLVNLSNEMVLALLDEMVE